MDRPRGPRPLRICVLVSLLASFVPTVFPKAGEIPIPGLNAVVGTADALFQAMERRDYERIWLLLSEESRATIVKETARAFAKAGREGGDPESLAGDFAAGGPVARDYWNGFLAHFDPRQALDESRWELGKVDAKRAEIRLTHKHSERPALLMLYHEDGRWRVGLVESFWGRR